MLKRLHLQIIFVLVVSSICLNAQNPAMEYLVKHDYLNAIAELKKMQMKKPSDPGIKNKIAVSYYKLGSITEVLYRQSCYFGKNYYDVLIKNDPSKGQYYYFQGLCLVGLNNFELAKKAFKNGTRKKIKPYAERSSLWLSGFEHKKVTQVSMANQLELAYINLELEGNVPGSLSIDKLTKDLLSKDINLYHYLMLSIAENRQKNIENTINSLNFTLLEFTEERKDEVTQQTIRYYYYHPMALKYLSIYYYRKSLEYYYELLAEVDKKEHEEIVARKISMIISQTHHQEAVKFCRGRKDPFIRNWLGKVYWETGKKSEAKKIWDENIKSDLADVKAYAGYFSAKYGADRKSGIQALNQALKSTFEQKQVYRQDYASMLAEIYMLENDIDKAIFEFDKAFTTKYQNDPVFLIKLAEVMYHNPSRHNTDVLPAIDKVLTFNKLARQLHYYIQGLVVSQFNSRIGKVK